MPENHLRIGERRIGPNEPCFIIAEVGVNHNGDLKLAKQLVDAAVRAGVDAVKFQKRQLNQVYQEALIEQPQRGEQGLQYLLPLLVEFELSENAFRELHDYCRQKGILSLCTPWDRGSVDFLESLEVAAYKIGSPDMTNFPLIEYVIDKRKPVIVSTGMSTEDEIRRTLAFLSERGAACALLHCVSTYPTAPEETNLRFMQTLREWSGWPVGYSGHDTGTAISLAAVAMGASILEKHLTLDRSMRGPDHSASLEPDEFADLVRSVREVEIALGASRRWMTRGEVLNRRVLSKSLVAQTDIPSGTVITRDMVASKSPGMGLSPQRVNQLIGRRLSRSLRRDEMFLDNDIDPQEAARRLKAIDVGTRWGIVARFLDVDKLLDRFAPLGMSFIEFHVSDRDLDAGIAGFKQRRYPFDLVVHAPEYVHDRLIDLCAADPEQRQLSVQRIQQTIDLTRQMTPSFQRNFSRGPKIVFHAGGMSPRPGSYDLAAASERLLDSIRKLDRSGVDLLLENLPPFPWYFGGRWFGYVLTDPENTEQLCAASGLGLCFDTSHAGLECHRTGARLIDFARRILPHLRHLHVSDAAGTSGEGLQIGEGQINFVELLPVLLEAQPTLIPEIWMGHHQDGQGFHLALEHLTDIIWAGGVLGRAAREAVQPELHHLVVPAAATVFTTIQTIDRNKMGIAFVVDEKGVVLGVVTDGDIRHGFVQGKNLHTPIADIMTRNYVYATADMSPAEVRARLPGRSRILPILDNDRRLVNFASDLYPREG